MCLKAPESPVFSLITAIVLLIEDRLFSAISLVLSQESGLSLCLSKVELAPKVYPVGFTLTSTSHHVDITTLPNLPWMLVRPRWAADIGGPIGDDVLSPFHPRNSRSVGERKMSDLCLALEAASTSAIPNHLRIKQG